MVYINLTHAVYLWPGTGGSATDWSVPFLIFVQVSSISFPISLIHTRHMTLVCLGQFPGTCCEKVCFRFELSSVAFIHLFMNVSLEKLFELLFPCLINTISSLHFMLLSLTLQLWVWLLGSGTNISKLVERHYVEIFCTFWQSLNKHLFSTLHTNTKQFQIPSLLHFFFHSVPSPSPSLSLIFTLPHFVAFSSFSVLHPCALLFLVPEFTTTPKAYTLLCPT